jgi:pyrroline-5-carboxylate reductase
MENKTLGFIGGGRITKIFLHAFANKDLQFQSVKVFDTSQEVLSSLKSQFQFIHLGQNAREVAGQENVFIALHPPAIMETLEEIRSAVRQEAVVFSLAPKISIEKIQQKLGVKNIVRQIPNATSYINQGYNPVCYSGTINPAAKSSAAKLLEYLGHTFEVEEPKLESYAILSAMLPTYFWFQWEEMRRIGKEMGLDEAECNEAIHETMVAALKLMFSSGLSFEQVADLIPVKPIGEHEPMIRDCFRSKLLPLFEKIKP